MSSILQFPVSTDFSPEQTHAMGEAFDLVRMYVRVGGQSRLQGAEGEQLIAHHILDKATHGERDPAKLAEYAIALLKI